MRRPREPANGPEDAPQERYRPLSGRRRLLIALLAVATAVTLVLMMLERAGAPETAPPPAAAGPLPCGAGQTSGCIGGRADVILLPPAGVASAAGAGPKPLP